jgi:hypothetical protein
MRCFAIIVFLHASQQLHLVSSRLLAPQKYRGVLKFRRRLADLEASKSFQSIVDLPQRARHCLNWDYVSLHPQALFLLRR